MNNLPRVIWLNEQIGNGDYAASNKERVKGRQRYIREDLHNETTRLERQSLDKALKELHSLRAKVKEIDWLKLKNDELSKEVLDLKERCSALTEASRANG